LIIKIPEIEKIILFGSYSRKKPHYGSDVDLLITVKKRTKNDFKIIYTTLYDISTDFEWSPLIITEEKLRKPKKERKHFFQEIFKDGIVIFDKKN
jgi:predicted nucleotidyltransferase